MLYKVVNGLAIGSLFLATACAQQPETGPVPLEPVYSKFGGVSACIDSSGRTHEIPGGPRQDQRENPCDPPDECEEGYFDTATLTWICRPPGEECDIGFYNQAGQWICRDYEPEDSTDPNPGRDPSPNDPTGAQG